ncbi:hypothetical protein F4779DRAFT_614557 [Xylariaceae sp. FL0662B]|nr:hypothetical protein F4779DRAFT_614557 [Xylariaceae sp. FL0662B]
MYSTTTLLTTAAALSGLALGAPALEQRYVSGRCGLHATQYQKNENGVGAEYQFTVQVKDAVGAILGGADNAAVADYGSLDIYSQLPAVVVLTAGAADSDPVTFSYNGATFSSSNGCSTGGFDGGARQMDCGFTC